MADVSETARELIEWSTGVSDAEVKPDAGELIGVLSALADEENVRMVPHVAGFALDEGLGGFDWALLLGLGGLVWLLVRAAHLVF